jgi:RHS repeat-associated protein
VGTTTYTYDVLGNLTRVVLPNATIIGYLIDGENRRVGKKVNGTVVKRWLYHDGLKPVAELDGTGALVSQFVYGSNPNVPDYVVKSGVKYRIAADQLGSVRLVINVSTGAIAQVMQHDAWGNVVQDTSVGFTPFGFAGGLYDSDTGLVRFGARDYNPVVGRWTAKESDRFAEGPSLYAYAGADPINLLDPTGHYAAVATGAEVGAEVGAAVGGPAGAVVGAVVGAAVVAIVIAIVVDPPKHTCLDDGDDPDPPDPPDCEALYATDSSTCRAISRLRGAYAGQRCWASAGERYGACIARRPIPPLDTWNQ